MITTVSQYTGIQSLGSGLCPKIQVPAPETQPQYPSPDIIIIVDKLYEPRPQTRTA